MENQLQPGRIYSLLDIMGHSFRCDNCGRETAKTMMETMGRLRAQKDGWLISDERDLCPHCASWHPSLVFYEQAH